MYCELDNAYNTASDLLTQKSAFVQDDIINDHKELIEQCHPKDVFTAQGDFKPYSTLGDACCYGFDTNDVSEFSPFGELNKSSDGSSISEIARANAVPQITKENEKQIRNIVNESFHDILNKNKLSIDEMPIKKSHIVQQCRDATTSRINIGTHIRDGIIITCIGILIIFLLDILIRIGKKL